MDFVYKACETNRHGAYLLATSENGCDALVALSKALATMTKLAKSNILNKEELSSTRDTRNQSNPYAENHSCSSVVDSRQLSFTKIPIPALADEHLHLYNKAIIYQSPREECCTKDDLRIHISVILFNMALCLHKTGKLERRKELLRRACYLYERCHKCIQQINSVARVDAHIEFLALIALNNHMQICFELQNCKYKVLLSQMASLLQKSKQSIRANRELVLNIVILRNLSKNHASAA